MFNKNIEKEYIITNGLGGFASSSITGANTRKYHAILNAALNPPVNRTVLLSKVKTHVITNKHSAVLESTEFQNHIEDKTDYMMSFTDIPLPTFVYQVDHTNITKTLSMVYGENTSTVHYKVKTTDEAVKIRVELHVNSRDHHDLSRKDAFMYDVQLKDQKLTLKNSLTTFFIEGFGTYNSLDKWGNEEFYRIDKRRGQEDIDRNYIPGYFEITIPAYTCSEFAIIASTEPETKHSDMIIADELKRRKSLYLGDDEIMKRLHIASDHFIVERQSTQSKTVIAGYPWFTDWGRDTMIALPGLTLSTGRFDDAKNIIETFIKYEKDGLIPNMFPDDNVKPMYNTIDGTLWLFIAVYQYLKQTEDQAFVTSIYPTLQRIIKKHIEGTVYNIHVDTDGLLSGGDETTQLTWMDVKIDGVVVTPRHGKAVEINALWYNSLMIMHDISKNLEQDSEIDYLKYAALCKTGFKKFWNQNDKYLYDLIQDNQPVNCIRPNQIFAVSLPFSLLSKEKELAVVKKVEEELLTPFGLRSLSKDHIDYKPIYNGDVYQRDYAYHQGTVWGWLIGPYLEAHYKLHNNKAYIQQKLQGLFAHLDDTGIGTISEVFSGNEPHHARGCFGQAWSVSETLRVYKMIE